MDLEREISSAAAGQWLHTLVHQREMNRWAVAAVGVTGACAARPTITTAVAAPAHTSSLLERCRLAAQDKPNHRWHHLCISW